MAKEKKIKLEKIPKIKRRIMKLWSEKVREANNHSCAVCGLKSGDIVNGKKQKIDAHHIESRTNHNLMFSFLNGIPLCVWHHKFSVDSFHRSPVFSLGWLSDHRPLQFKYVKENRNNKIDLDDRETLYAIEAKLKLPLTTEEIEILNLNDTSDKTQYYPKEKTTTTTTQSTSLPESLK